MIKQTALDQQPSQMWFFFDAAALLRLCSPTEGVNHVAKT
jgi:hypothetical protein